MASAPITEIKGIGPRRAEAFGRLGLFSVDDLLRFVPRGYIDYSKAALIQNAEQGSFAAVEITVLATAKTARIRGGLTITNVAATDGVSKLGLCWYNQPYAAARLKDGDTFYACGRVDKRRGYKLINPSICKELPGIVPQYALTSGLTQGVVRQAAQDALEMCSRIEETLPQALLDEFSLMPLDVALRCVHMPDNFKVLEAAKERLAFEDMLLYALMLKILRQRRESGRGTAFNTQGMTEKFLSKIPFEPTNAQKTAMADIAEDMAHNKQMNRLLQGDVGSGKTAVALFAMFIAIENGYSAALMAPTEILADQHYRTLKSIFGEKAVLLKGGMKKSERDQIAERLMSGEPLAITGTHAIISSSVEIAKLGLVIADEQHRFGVKQRAAISAKGTMPDTLIMSATPIPRTLSLLLYGDLELSVLDELPPGRKPIKTMLVPRHKREDMYKFIEKQLLSGAQCYAVCPLVEESEALSGVLSASMLYKELSQKLNVSTELMHGRLNSAQKQAAAAKFAAGETKLLVSTTVVEVGIDVPNAAIMVIENADRFGLAQLHQLRGRVGRGTRESYCFLLSGSDSDTAKERLKVLCQTADGFKIAEKDLELRGPGELLGSRQHGEDQLSAALLAGNMKIFTKASEVADRLLASNESDCELVKRAAAIADEKTKNIAEN